MSVLCNREDCRFNTDQSCTAEHTGIVDRQCVTYRRVKREPDYRELMQPSVGICQREGGSMKRKSTGVLK